VPGPDSTSLATLPPTRRALLTALKKAGEARADDLAEALGITVSAVRQHVAGLAADGLVEHREVRAGAGRPHHLYRLSERGDRLFPRAYGSIVLDLLEEVEDEDPAMLDRLFQRRRRRRVEGARTRLAGKDLAGQVAELTAILDEDGYLAEAIDTGDGSFRIVEHNCAILAVASRYGTACGTELDFIREVLPGATVERVSHLLSGGTHCAYEVVPLAGSVRSSRTRTPRKPSPIS
jgi:DeoR family suf operon transcriptional repressor